MKYIDDLAVFEKKFNTNIKKELQDHICEFYYRKLSGEKRHAYGTLMEDVIKYYWEPSDDEDAHKPSDEYVVYWDIEKKNFRQFSPDAFLELVKSYDTLDDFIKDNPKLEKKVKKAL